MSSTYNMAADEVDCAAERPSQRTVLASAPPFYNSWLTTRPFVEVIPNTGNSPNASPYGGPRWPEWEDFNKRLQSFKLWPPQMAQKPIDLAKAGFAYTGHDDCVKCYFCSGKLYKFEPLDVPLVEHRRFFPECYFAAEQYWKT